MVAEQTALIAAAGFDYSGVVTWPDGRPWHDLSLERISRELLEPMDLVVGWTRDHYWGQFDAAWIVELSHTDGRPHLHVLVRRQSRPKLKGLRRAATGAGLGRVELQSVRSSKLNMSAYALKMQLFGLTLTTGAAGRVAAFAMEANGGSVIHHTPEFFGPDGRVDPGIQAAAAELLPKIWRWVERKNDSGELRKKMPKRLLDRLVPVGEVSFNQSDPELGF